MTRYQSRTSLQRATVKAQHIQARVDTTERNRAVARLAKQQAEQAARDKEAKRAALANGEGEIIPNSQSES
jgi:hypothetical protein